MTPLEKHQLTRYTMAAKHIIYEPGRMQKFLQMLGTQAGALHAVHTVIAIIEKNMNVPQPLVKQLGVNIYLVMVEVAEKVTGHKADPGIAHSVIQKIGGSIAQSHPATVAPKGIIGSNMGVSA